MIERSSHSDSSLSASSHHSIDASQLADATGTALGIPMFESAALLQGGKRVHIAHNGSCYQLQTTRQGKLILTK